MHKPVVVTGASGHIGFHVARRLLQLGYSVVLLVRSENENTDLLQQLGAALYKVDLQDPGTYAHLLAGSKALFHLAAENTTDTSDEQRTVANTFQLAKTVIDTAVSSQVKTIIYTSSVVVLGRASSQKKLIDEQHKATIIEGPYWKGKLLAEEYCEQVITNSHADIRRIYPSWVLGGNDLKLTPPHRFILDYLQGGQVFYFDGGISITSVEEVANAHVNAWLIGKPFGKYVVAGHNLTFRQLYKLLSKHADGKAPYIYLPKWLILAGSYVARKILGSDAPIDPSYVKAVIGRYGWYNSDKAIREINYNIIAVDEIIDDAITNIRKRQLGAKIIDKQNKSLRRIIFPERDILLITGVPGVLGNRMLDILINGDNNGNYAATRKIRVLIHPQYTGLVDLPAKVEIIYGDITDPEILAVALKNVTAVYHLAGVIYPNSIKEFYEVNYQGTKNIVDAGIQQGTRRILFMSTDSICGYGTTHRIFTEHEAPRPYKHYGKSKYLAEKYLLDKTKEGLIDGTSLRGFWFFGPFMPERNVKFFQMFHWRRQIVFGDGKNYRSISHVDDVVQAFVKAENSPRTIGKWYWIGSKKIDYTVNDIYNNIADGLQVPFKPFYLPKWLCEIFSWMDTLLSKAGILNATLHAAGKFHKDIAGEISAAERDFNYHPVVDFNQIKKELKAVLEKAG